MKKIYILALFLISSLALNADSLNIQDSRIFDKIIKEQLGNFEPAYKITIAVNITIDEDGEFSYEILNDSSIEGFKDDLEKFLDTKTDTKFPTFKNQKTTMKVEFTPKDLTKMQEDKYNKYPYDHKRKY